MLEQLTADDQDLKDVNLNNVTGIDEKQICEIFEALKKNSGLTKLSVVNCDINDFSISTLIVALEENQNLLSLNLEGNRISPDTLASLFECLATCRNGLIEVRVAGQAQEKMGFRIESRIADAIEKNPRLIKLGIQFEFKEVMNRVSKHLIKNMDNIRRRRKGEVVEVVDWTQAREVI